VPLTNFLLSVAPSRAKADRRQQRNARNARIDTASIFVFQPLRRLLQLHKKYAEAVRCVRCLGWQLGFDITE